MSQMGTTDQQKIAQFISLLTGKAIKWATVVWEKGHKLTTLYKNFIELFHRMFNHSPEGAEVGKQ